MAESPIAFTQEQAQRIWRAVLRTEGMSVTGGDFFKTDSSLSISVHSGGQSGGATQMRVKSEGDDHIVCREWDGVNEGVIDILVAKPYLMRRSVYDDTTNAAGWLRTYVNANTRTASKDGEDTVTHTIDPPYAVNDVIYADQPANGTGASYSGSVIQWCDTNRDSRIFSEDC